MLIVVNRYENSITGSVNGKPFGIAYTEQRWNAMKELEDKQHAVTTVEEQKTLVEEFEPLTKESYKEVVETACPFIGVNASTEKYYLKFANGTYDSWAMPKALVDRILKSVEQKDDFLPLVKFWVRVRRNPQMTEKKAKKLAKYINKTYLDVNQYNALLAEGLADGIARERATSFQTPITVEGLLVTYKVSREKKQKFAQDADGNPILVDRYPKEVDEETGIVTYKEPDYVEERVYEPAVHSGGDLFFCSTAKDPSKPGYIIKVGAVHRLDNWSQVNCNDDASCVKGLHAGNLDYIRGYQNTGTVTHNTFIDPMHVGAVTDDGSGALRVLQYFTYGSFQGVNKSVYHSSTYAKMGDDEFKANLVKIQQDLVSAANDASVAATAKSQELDQLSL